MRASLDGILVIDTNGRFMEVSDAYCRMVGYTREELLSMSAADVEATQSPEGVHKRMQEVYKTGRARFRTGHRRKDGAIVELDISTTYLEVLRERFFLAIVREVAPPRGGVPPACGGESLPDA